MPLIKRYPTLANVANDAQEDWVRKFQTSIIKCGLHPNRLEPETI
jgi:hypothetical protein